MPYIKGNYASDMGHGHILDSYALLFGIWRHILLAGYPFTLSGGVFWAWYSPWACIHGLYRNIRACARFRL